MTSLKDIKEQIIKIKTEITEIDIAEGQQEQIIKIKLILLILISLNLKFNLKNKSATELKRGGRNLLNSRRERRNLLNSREREKEPTELKREKEPTELKRERETSEAPLKQCITADKPPYQRASSESRQAHSHRIPSFPIAIP